MYKLIITALLLASLANAQTKKSSQNPKSKEVVSDSTVADTASTLKEEDVELPREFKVYSRKPRSKAERMKLCLNLVSEENVLNYCVNDSICKDPEVAKILFEQKQGDSTFVLVHVQAFSKAADKPECDAGKEVKLFFVRWNTKSNKAIVKQKNVESCMKVITNMSREPISNWDGVSVLTVNYHRGGDNFIEIKFDPQRYQQGIQSSNDTEPK